MRGAFAYPNFPAPRWSVYEEREHAWAAVLGDDVEHDEAAARRAGPIRYARSISDLILSASAGVAGLYTSMLRSVRPSTPKADSSNAMGPRAG